MKPELTIGICVRNCENFLKEAIDSVINQDFPHESMEVIFVDDGSEDRTLSIIQEYASKTDVRIKVFCTPKKGLGHARNIVVANAAGDFVLWVDGDMILSKDYVKELVGFMQQHPSIGIAKGKMSLEPGKNLLGTLETYSRYASKIVDYNSDKARTKSIGTGGSIYRLEAAKQVGGFDQELKGYGEDMDIEIRIRDAGWAFGTTNANFLDYERRGLTWKKLWNRYLLRGYYTHYFLHKNRGLIKNYTMLPPAAFLLGLLHAQRLFKLTRTKAVFFLPFQYVIKNAAFCYGFMRSHLVSFAPKS